jgi:hypothetical protein
METIGFVGVPPSTPEAEALFAEDVAEDGYVMNVSRLWAYNPLLLTGLFDLMGQAVAGQGLSFRDRGILVAACASTLGDSYCSLAWGAKLAGVSDPGTAAAVLDGTDVGVLAGTEPVRWQGIPTAPAARTWGVSVMPDSAILRSSPSPPSSP